MMNKKRSSNAGILKYLLILPLCALISLVINADAWAATLPQQEKKNVTYSGTVVDADGNKLANVRIRYYNAQMLAGEKQRTNMAVVLGAPVPSMDELAQKGTDHVYQVVDEMPQFPGGNRAMMAYIGQNIKYPAEAHAKGIEGRVLVQFVVNKEGDLQDIKVMKSIDPLLDQEAIRVISSMPKWTPGKLKGEAVNIQYVLPIQFNIPKKAQQK